MDKFIRRENLALFRGRLDDLGITDAQRKAILRLLTKEHARGHTSVPLIHIKAPGQLLGYCVSFGDTPMSTWGLK
jgi:hypothetical protein